MILQEIIENHSAKSHYIFSKLSIVGHKANLCRRKVYLENQHLKISLLLRGPGKSHNCGLEKKP